MLEVEGFQLVCGVVPDSELEALRSESIRLSRLHPDEKQGVRDLLRRSPLIRELSHKTALRSLLPSEYRCVRGILFDKSPDANWLVAWHQDLTIAVQQQHECTGYGPWSTKHSAPHVQPPTALLESMITLRLHLDHTHAENGALRVLPGSHLTGRLDAEAIARWKEHHSTIICEANAGDVLMMKPLLLHASSKATSPSHRRVIHLEFAPPDMLANTLSWYECAG